jgi:hypothetical protein
MGGGGGEGEAGAWHDGKTTDRVAWGLGTSPLHFLLVVMKAGCWSNGGVTLSLHTLLLLLLLPTGCHPAAGHGQRG